MDKPTYKVIGQPCGQHGQYTFYKALKISGETERILAIGDFFFLKIWQDSELVAIGELQLLWTDRVSDQTLVSLRIYFLPENTPDGRNGHGEDEVLAINDKVVIRAEDLLSWLCDGHEWRWGRKAVWRGACAPPPAPPQSPETPEHAPLCATKLDLADVQTERDTVSVDPESPGVVVFSYPRYCRYRAVVARLEGIQSAWLRDSLVAALGGFAAPTRNTRILYCKDTFEYPELEGHEFVCNQLAPRVKPRARGRRRRHRSTDPQTPRRISLRNGPDATSDDEPEKPKPDLKFDLEKEDQIRIFNRSEEKVFIKRLKAFYKERNETFKLPPNVKESVSLSLLYRTALSRGGYAALCARGVRGWALVHHDVQASHSASDTRSVYERFLLPLENHERRISKMVEKCKTEPETETIELSQSPPPEPVTPEPKPPSPPPSPASRFDPSNLLALNTETGETERVEVKESSQTAERTEVKISVKPVETLMGDVKDSNPQSDASAVSTSPRLQETASAIDTPLDVALVNGHITNAATNEQKGATLKSRSSLRSVRVKPTRAAHSRHLDTTSVSVRSESSSSSPPSLPPAVSTSTITTSAKADSDDEIVEVPYQPAPTEVIDLDEYPESPRRSVPSQAPPAATVTTTLPPWPPVPTPAILPPQLLSHAQLLHMYNIMPPSYPNGAISAPTNPPPKVFQAKSIFGSSGPEKIVYGNPKDPFMPPPHILQGTPIKPMRNIPDNSPPIKQDILDLTCKTSPGPPQIKPAVEIVRVPNVPSPKIRCTTPQNLAKNYTLIDGKAVIGSNLEITLVNPKTTPVKSRPPQKRSSNGKFVSVKTPTPPKEQKGYPTPPKIKPSIIVPNYQANLMRDDPSPTGSNSSRDSAVSMQNNMYKNPNLAQLMEMQAKNPVPSLTPFMDPVYMGALYNSLAGQMDQRQLAFYRELMANQFRGYGGVLNLEGVTNTPTTKN